MTCSASKRAQIAHYQSTQALMEALYGYLAEELSVEFAIGGNVPIAWGCERNHYDVAVGGRDLGQFERGKAEVRCVVENGDFAVDCPEKTGGGNMCGC
jgi:hypothetical protein